MIQTIAFIPARGGSTSIKLKNIKLFYNKPLILWNIEALLAVDNIDEVIVATDSQAIADCVKGIEKVKVYWRKAENAQNESSTESVMLEYIEAERLSSGITFMLVQATSPFTKTEHYQNGLTAYRNTDFAYDSMLACVPFKHLVWSKRAEALTFDPNNRQRRQDFEGNYLENGAFYINSVKNIVKSKSRISGKIGFVEMPEYTFLELDEPLDWKIGEMIMHEVQQGNLK